MKLNQKTLRQLRRALRREATYLVKFQKEIIDSGLTGGGSRGLITCQRRCINSCRPQKCSTT